MAAVIADHVPTRNADFSMAAKQQCLFPALRCLLFGWTLM
jgi:hypothetical protein